jgi:hypothetical protein
MIETDEHLLRSAAIADERLTFAIIVRGRSDDIRKLKAYIENNKLTLVFKKFSLDNLYVINPTEYQQLQQLQDK